MDDLLLDRYLSDDCDELERARVAKRIITDPILARRVEQLRTFRDVMRDTPQFSADDLWSGVQSRLKIKEHRATDAQNTTHLQARSAGKRFAPKVTARRHTRFIWPLIAAAAVLMIAFGVSRFAMQHQTGALKQAAPTTPDRLFTTHRAERADVRFSDGTHVILNVDSRLQVPASYGQGARVVMLDGEAFFEVAHDITRPFSVLTKAGVAEDLGTAFVVSSYAEDRGMRVSVVTGEVALRRDSAAARIARLEGGEAARMDSSGKVTSRQAINVKNELAWTTGRLVFFNTPLKEALPRMSRWFDAEILLGDSALANEEYTASFRDQSLATVLELLPESFNARVEREGNAYVLYPTKRAR